VAFAAVVNVSAATPTSTRHHAGAGEVRHQARSGLQHTEGERGPRDQAPLRPSPTPGRQRRPQQRPDREERRQPAVCVGAQPELVASQQRQRQVEGDAERRHEEHQRQHRHQLRPPADVAQAFTQLARLTCGRRRAVQPVRVHPQQPGEHGGEADRVEQEHPAGPDRCDQHAGDGGADDAGDVEGHGVERHRVRQPLRADYLGDEGLPHRHVHSGEAAQHETEREDLPERDESGHVEQAERQRARAQSDLDDQQDAALVVAVGEHAAPQRQHQHRRELQGRGDPECHRAAARELEHEPVLGHPLHPGAGERDDLAGREEPVVAAAQGGEHPRGYGGGSVGFGVIDGGREPVQGVCHRYS